MPIGLAIMKWNPRVGTEILAKYPEEISLSAQTLMQIYSTHEYAMEPGMISLMVGHLNIASYYSGPEKAIYIILLLNLDDDPDTYEGGLTDAARIVLQNLEDDAYKPMIPSLFQRISAFPTLTNEQKLAVLYEDEIYRLIIDRLRDEGVVSKSELKIWLKDKYRESFIDIDAILMDLIKKEIVKEVSVKGMPSELIFFINDILMIRRPPIKIFDNPVEKGLPEQLVTDYSTAIKKYFENYRPSEEDNLKALSIMTDPEIYEIIKLLRTAIVTRNTLEKLRKKGVSDIDGGLKQLWENEMIQVFQDKKGNEYYALLSDFHISLVYPKYILSTIIHQYDVKSKSDKVLIEYINVLEDAYFEMKHKAKSTIEE
ncbi:MAG: hypothetical protein EU539_06665 [Promethearchaeota archaeon]|nr:MAG: hypothetical protein EU539_06665 [Candidatus Lokiarchaeota archaeon]